MIRSCPLCDHADLLPVLHRARTMVSSNRLYASEAEARDAPVGELSIVLCRHCGFVFNATFDLQLVPYGPHYDNDQSQSPSFLAHMTQMAARVRAAVRGQPLRAVEVGCGQGQFLRLLLSDSTSAVDRAVGFDPSYAGGAISGCTIHAEFFGAESAAALDFRPNVVLSRHVIEHVPAPREMLSSIRRALADAPEVTVCFETPSIDWIFENNTFWDLCYEHCSYFTESSLAFAFESCDFRPRAVERVFGRQYLWIEATPAAARSVSPTATPSAAEQFSQAHRQHQQRWQARLEELAGRSRVAVWGAATKGATFVQDVDPDRTRVHSLIDINPRKQQCYIPLTAHPVLDWQSALADGVSTLIVSNPNYLAEIKQLLGPHAARLEFLAL